MSIVATALREEEREIASLETDKEKLQTQLTSTQAELATAKANALDADDLAALQSTLQAQSDRANAAATLGGNIANTAGGNVVADAGGNVAGT